MSNWPLHLSVLAACIATVTDLRTRTIPNWLTLSLLSLGLTGHAIAGGTMEAFGAAVGCLVCFLPSYFLFSRGALGGGDVKLFAAFGATLGARDGLELQLAAFMLVCAFAVWSMAWNGRLWALMRASYQATLHLALPNRFARPEAHPGSQELPMGLGILLASLLLVFRSAL